MPSARSRGDFITINNREKSGRWRKGKKSPKRIHNQIGQIVSCGLQLSGYDDLKSFTGIP
jgi:hypothetical protein